MKNRIKINKTTVNRTTKAKKRNKSQSKWKKETKNCRYINNKSHNHNKTKPQNAYSVAKDICFRFFFLRYQVFVLFLSIISLWLV